LKPDAGKRPESSRSGTTTTGEQQHLHSETDLGAIFLRKKLFQMAHLDLVTLVVEGYDPAIEFFVEKVGV
jgi:hypothetical protein